MNSRAGFTLLETIVSIAVFTVIGGALALATRAGQQTERSVTDEASTSRSLRSVSSTLTGELRSSTDAQISVTALADGNDSLRFQVPIRNGTALGWGVYERSLGSTEAEQNRAGWSLCYTVESVVAGGQTKRRLVRQVLDQAQVVQSQRVVLDRLHSGTEVPPGFTVRRQGALWEITLSANARTAHGRGIQEVFHVQARNQQ